MLQLQPLNRWRSQTGLGHRSAFLTLCRSVLVLAVAGCLAFAATPAAHAQDETPDATTSEDAGTGAEDDLSLRQDSISVRYDRFEKTLLELADQMRKTDPDRANLLFRGISQSKEKQVREQLEFIGRLINERRLGDVVDRQEDVIETMAGLLQLLQSEDRRSEIEREQERLRDLIKDVDNLIGGEKDVRADTERGADFDRAAERQQGLAESAQKLLDKIDQQDRERAGKDGRQSPGGDAEPSEGGSPAEQSPNGEQRPSERQPGEREKDEPKSGDPEDGKEPGENGEPKDPSDQEPSEDSASSESKSGESKSDQSKSNESKSGESKSGESKSGEPSESSPSESESESESSPSESQPGQSQPMPSGGQQQSPSGGPSESSPSESQPQTPGREQLEQAKREMERAIEELKKEARDDASDRQDQAIAELQEAKAELEEILRQLREEEKELMLTALEARLRDMLGKQLIIYQGTVALGETPEEERTGRHTSRAIQLSRDEQVIGVEIEKALLLLREEGSSVAFPEALRQLQEDVRMVASRLERVEVGELTQAIEQDIIEALEEMVDALQKELEKLKDQQQQQQQQQNQPQDEALVDILGELKMLRSLQLRVNRATRRYGRMVEGEQATDPDLVQQLQELGRRQARIRQATYDLSTGRNQ